MGFAAASEPVVRAAWATGILCLALSAALVLQVSRMRRRLARRRRGAEAVVAAWRPVLFAVVAGGSPSFPALAPEDEDAFLLLWLRILDAIRGAPLARLAAAGEALGARAMARRRLAGDDAVGRILALRTLGYLRHREDRGEVLRWLADPRAYVSLAAARALVHLDPAGAADEILPRLAARSDFPVPLFASLLEEADPQRLAAAFRAVCASLSGAALARVLPLASLLPAAEVEELLARLLERERDPEVLSAALRQVRAAALLPAVRRVAVHERWPVRVQAAAALGRLGAAGDGDLLLEMTRDPEWWVRYRAAQALAGGRFAPPEELAGRAEGLRDRFARDMVQQVLAEAPA